MSGLESKRPVLILYLNHDDRPSVLEQERSEDTEQLGEPESDPSHEIFLRGSHFDLSIFQKPRRQSSKISLGIHEGAGAKNDVESDLLSCCQEGDNVLVASEVKDPRPRLMGGPFNVGRDGVGSAQFYLLQSVPP